MTNHGSPALELHTNHANAIFHFPFCYFTNTWIFAASVVDFLLLFLNFCMISIAFRFNWMCFFHFQDRPCNKYLFNGTEYIQCNALVLALSHRLSVNTLRYRMGCGERGKESEGDGLCMCVRSFNIQEGHFVLWTITQTLVCGANVWTTMMAWQTHKSERVLERINTTPGLMCQC